MPKVSISEATRLAGIARSNFYTTYIRKGRISVSKDSKGKRFIDMGELLRVFPDIKQDSRTGQQDNTKIGQNRTAEKNTTENNEPSTSTEFELLKTKLAASEAQVKELQSDKHWLQSQITNLTDSIKLLESPKQAQPEPAEPDPELEKLLKEIIEPRQWWQFWK